jgi:hypothetical protein
MMSANGTGVDPAGVDEAKAGRPIFSPALPAVTTAPATNAERKKPRRDNDLDIMTPPCANVPKLQSYS